MSQISDSRLPVLIAIVLLILCVWPLTSGIGKVWSLRNEIAVAQARANTPTQQDRHSWIVPGGSHGAAGAALQARLRATARKSDLSLTRVEVEPRDGKDPTRLQLQARAEGGVRAMAAFLHELETSSPVLVINEARLSADDGKLVLDMQILARTAPEAGS